MRTLTSALPAFAVVTAAAAQSPDVLLSDLRLSVHTLLREDVSAAYRNDNVERLARAERNIEVLLKERPDTMLTLLADTPYEAMARQWTADPSSAATTNLTCRNCHSPGRLANRLGTLEK